MGYSEYKSINYALRLPDAKIIFQKYTPYGTIQVVEASTLRKVVGLSYSFTRNIPAQKAIFLDGNLYGMITPLDSNREYLKWTT